jgi:hypothetical protein
VAAQFYEKRSELWNVRVNFTAKDVRLLAASDVKGYFP